MSDRFLLVIIILALYACHTKTSLPPGPQQAAATAVQIPPSINYDSCKRQVQLIKQQHKASWLKLPKAEKEKILVSAIAETIIPNWIGTKWDYNGTSEIPQKGNIACGYFVTTVLRDAGFKLARNKLAQCASEEMIMSMVQPKYVQRFSNASIDNFIKAIHSNSIDLYIVGLDNHTGFIYNDGKETYFIHSTYVGTRNVQKELAGSSWVLNHSRYRVLARLSEDPALLDKWINN